MKKSKADQEQTRIQLMEAAIDLMIQKGYEKASMREIARNAGVGDATIYNYFPTKESIVWAYIQWRHQQAVYTQNKIPDLEEYTLKEKLHSYFEILLEGFLPDKEFLPVAFKMTHQSFLTHRSEIKAINEVFFTQVRGFLDTAIEKEEIPDQPIDTLIPHLILDLYFIIIFYWMKDSSEHFQETTELIDLLLDIAVGVLKQGLIGQMMNLGGFLLRHHLFSHAQTFLEGSSFKDMQSELKSFLS